MTDDGSALGETIPAPRTARVIAFAADLVLVPLVLLLGRLYWRAVRMEPGQSPGKRLMGLAVRDAAGGAIPNGRILLRELLGWLMIAGPIIMLIAIPIAEPAENPGGIWAALTAVALIWLAASLLLGSASLLLKDGRGPRDRIFRTVVVAAER